MEQSKTYKGVDLLDKIFEFIAMTPNATELKSNALKANPPRYIRLRQIESLVRAFFGRQEEVNLVGKIKNLFVDEELITIKDILSGDFIKKREISDYTELVDFINGFVKEKEGASDEEGEIRLRMLVMPYQQLVEYKKQLIRLLDFNSGWLEASSVTSRFSIYLTNSVSNNLAGKFSDLDTALELFINPKGLMFTEDELKKNYGFPVENLSDIDIDFM
jgi:hypothetical protein